MDRAKKSTSFHGNKNNKIYLDLKDIIRENALPFLPAKSLFRFFGVCRDWKLLISTPFFVHSQSNSFRSISGFFYQTQAGKPSFMSLDTMAYGVQDPSLSFLPEPVDVRSSCNGLLCCQGRTGYNAYYICNPVTKKWKKLPKSEADHGHDPAVVLVFEPSLLNFTAEFKLVCAFPSELDGFEFEIYSSEKSSWRISGEICFSAMKLLPKTGINVNGIVYWQTTCFTILSFDLNSERSQLFSSSPVGTFGTRNGKLCSANARSQNIVVNMLSNTHTNTMQMNSKAKMWEEIKGNFPLDISLSASSSYYDASHGVPRGYGIGRGGVALMGGDVVVLNEGNKFYYYDMKKKASKDLGEVDIDTKVGIVGYVNSLVEL